MQKSLLVFIFFFLVTSCSWFGPTRPDPVQKKAGFLPDYSLLKLEVDTKQAKVYRYINPNARRNDYHAVIIDPVVLYQPTSESDNQVMAKAIDESSSSYTVSEITKDKVDSVRIALDDYLNKMISRQFTITTTPGVGVAKLSIAITGAELDKDGFQVRNLLPISAAIRLASMATGYDSKTPVLIIEVKVVDSVSGVLLGEAYHIVTGDSFRQEVNTADQFKELAKGWVDTALHYASMRNPDAAIESMPEAVESGN